MPLLGPTKRLLAALGWEAGEAAGWAAAAETLQSNRSRSCPMAFTLTQLDAIETAIASGTTRVSYDGKSVEYRTLDEMIRVRGIIRRALGVDAGGGATVLIAHGRGFPASGSADDGRSS